MTKYWKSGLIVGLVLSISLFFLLASCLAHAAKKADVVDDAIIVNVAKVATANIPKTVNALGSLSAVQVVTVSSESDGRVSQIHFKNGQEVGKGMPIVQLDNEQAQADYQSAMTALNLSRLKYQRSKLVPTAISQQELADLKANVDSEEAAVKSKQASLNQKQIIAPFSGVLGAFQVQVGDYVKAGDPIVTLVNTKQLRADYQLPESELPELKQGQLVKVATSAYPDKSFYGTVSFISPTVSKDTRSIAIQAVIPNDKGLLSPGMFVHVSQQVSVSKNAPVVPAEAVMADVKGYYVYKVVGNKVAQTYIQVGARIDEQEQVLKGLTVGDVVVTAGQQKLQDGSVIKVSNS
ncbi:efflux RND transporter periplasmic adaptor subunit [Candidiatus Paracoxiella cheracis]|uniref:efflux RND transporter periplasmic adaptor subunit n=1 Tax=Candidiatus Paracoxiella cheracis TaxID=3405120 RepID=UPI003BF476A8